MATDIRLVSAEPGHVDMLASNMRTEDAAEVQRSDGHTPLAAVRWCIARSDIAVTMLLEGEVAAMMGVGPTDDGFASVWLLSSTVVDKHKRAFLRACRPALGFFLARHPALYAMVDASYTKSIRWLQHLGADVREAVPFGPRGDPFHPVVFRRQKWAAL